MFSSMSAFLLFFIPSVVLVLLGILFEERLIAFEQNIKRRLFGKRHARQQRAVCRRQLHRVAPIHRPAAHDSDCAA